MKTGSYRTLIIVIVFLTNVNAVCAADYAEIATIARKAGRQAAFNDQRDLIWQGVGFAAGFSFFPIGAVAVPIIAGYWTSNPPQAVLNGIADQDENYRAAFVKSYRSAKQSRRFFLAAIGGVAGVGGRWIYEWWKSPVMGGYPTGAVP